MRDTLSPFRNHPAPLSPPVAYAVELHGMAIGVAVPVRGGYVFRTAEPTYLVLDGRRFRRMSQMRHAAGALRREKPAGDAP
ncbi:hypothetical protein [Defluviicoccus vanus]|uniref:Uncharacterized protein n=1 Tax=Defluviicoccus vanus TaxID=111831 RepID=A0A7H1N2B3_9PROT|nr:hypothetical protein [Defluviicoccus vanus]QNT69849.1 hypothetical protein HQ394_11630 [Defluviicoccus vanus]